MNRKIYSAFIWLCISQCMLASYQVRADTAPDIYDVRIEIEVNGKSLKQIFSIIEAKTDFTFSYSSKKIDLNKSVIINNEYKNLGKLLEFVSAQSAIVIK